MNKVKNQHVVRWSDKHQKYYILNKDKNTMVSNTLNSDREKLIEMCHIWNDLQVILEDQNASCK